MRFIGEEKEINVKTKNPEFLDWKWIDIDQITEIRKIDNIKIHSEDELEQARVQMALEGKND